MKFLCLLFLCFLIRNSFGQDISLEYTQDSGMTIQNIPITKNNQKLIIEGVKSFKKFRITVSNLPENHKIILSDETGKQIDVITANESKSITAKTELNNKLIQIIHENEKSLKTEIATIFMQILPKATLNIITKIPNLISLSAKVCEPCNFAGNALVYDYTNNSISYINNIKKIKMKLSKGRPVVGYPYSFTVKNINPFRDSVIVSNETIDFNTDVPDFFDRAFFSGFSLQSDDKDKKTKIIADVFELGSQLNKIISVLKDSKECTDICSKIQKTKDETEKYFISKFNYDPNQQDLITFITSNLTGIAPLFRDSVANILNKYRNFCNAKNYFNYNIPQIQNVDQYNFTLSVLPKIGTKSYTVVDHQPIIVNTVGGIKIDFSTGLFLTKLRDKRFNLKLDSTVIRNSYGGDSIVFNKRNQIVQLSDEKKLDFGVAALMHFYPRLTPYINLGLTLGVGASIGQNPVIRYLGGGSLLFGKSGRLGISFGCAAGFVDVLSDGYQNQQFTSVSDVKAITKKVFNTNSFWAVTFNIPLFKSVTKPGDAKKEEADDTKNKDSDSAKKEEDKKDPSKE